MFKKFVLRRLQKYVQKYFQKHPEVKLVVVTGSVGKTSTKRAIATIASQKLRVRMEAGNYNTEYSAPLGILGIEYPGRIKSVLAWLSVFRAARRRIRQVTDVDVIVQELGADHPGDIKAFGEYLRPDIAVVTGVTPEHMEYFGNLDKVAEEELAAANFSALALINRDDIDEKYAALLTNPQINTYGTSGAAEYRYEMQDFEISKGYTGLVYGPDWEEPFAAAVKLAGEHSLRPAIAGVAVAAKLGLMPTEIAAGMAGLRPVPGRMNILNGIVDRSIVIDDSYNSSPAAAAAAIQFLYSLNVPQRIAILGDMNELGNDSAREHDKLGKMCDPALLDWVVTIGPQSEQYLAPAAKTRGCQVKSFRSAIDAAGFARSVMEEGAAVLIKGSQNGIFAEEAVKTLCLMSEDDELVRQSPEWIAKKQAFFSKFA